MRTYYLFNIKKDIKNNLCNNQGELYKLLHDMYCIRDVKYEVSLFNTVCNLIDDDVIISYLNNKPYLKKHNNKYLMYDYLFEVNKSNIVIKSMVNVPEIFTILNIYSKNFFVADFYNNDYFWLDQMCRTYCKL